MKYVKAGALLAVFLVVAGCAQAPKKQAFNREAAVNIKQVVIARSADETEYQANVLGHPGMSFGLIGGLVAAADMQAKSNRLTTALDPKKTQLSRRLAETLGQDLARDGYAPTLVELPKDVKAEQVLDIARKNGPSDAVVAIGLSGGYWAAGPSTDYFPRLLAVVKTYDAKTGTVLYEDTISYGYAMPHAQTVHLASDAKFRFRDMDTLEANAPLAREGLQAGLDAIAHQIATDLKKN